MNASTLNHTTIDEVIAAFLLAFEGYYVKMPTDYDYYKTRWKAAGVDLGRSYGMFDGDQLVAFIIHAVDERAGQLTAFNTGTGVLPAYRGRRLVKALYQYALPDLKQHGFEHSSLEVITKNEKAIRAYQSVGFTISRHYKCFAGKVKTDVNEPFELHEKALATVNWDALPNQAFYSWDFQQGPILAGNNTFYEVWHDGRPEAFFLLNPERTRLLQFDLLATANSEAWNRLFSAIKQTAADKISTINVDDRLTDKVAALHSVGLEITVEQFQMEMGVV